MEKKEIKIKYFNDRTDRLEFCGGKSDWTDLRCAEDISMKAGEFRLIPLGVAMQLPPGFEAHIVPRSSSFGNYGIIQANGVGIIDSSYCGDDDQWYFPAIALRDTEISQNDRICQFRIFEKQPQLDFVEVESLENENRGGFGSTGRA